MYLLIRREIPRLCRGGRRSLTNPGVCLLVQVGKPSVSKTNARLVQGRKHLQPPYAGFRIGCDQAPLRARNRKAFGSAGGYLLSS